MALVAVDLTNGVTWTGGLLSNTVGTFVLRGGQYALTVFDTGTANATLSVQTPNGNFAPIGAWTANGSVIVTLAAGTYKIVFGGSITLCDGSLVPVSLHPTGQW